MASEGITHVAGSSPYPSSYYSEEEEEIERSQKSKLREMTGLLKRPGREVGGEEGEPEEVEAIIDLSRKLYLSCGDQARDGTSSQPHQRQEPESDDDEDEVLIVGEKGEVALRDYPHSRHLCGMLPFSKTHHESYCDQCYCYVCDMPAPCEQWKESSDGHCNATDQDDMWNNLRKAKRSNPQAKMLLTSC